MSSKPVIQQLIAGVLLLVFAFSITPKRFLHDAIADHHDQSAQVTGSDHTQVHHTGFVCKCDNLVAESPFTNDALVVQLIPERVFSVKPAVPLGHLYVSAVIFTGLRGPPPPAV